MIVRTVEQALVDELNLKPNVKLLVAVSGGPDSMGLLYSLIQLRARYEWKLTVVHVNHQLRGAESEADAEFVKSFCEKWNVPCVIEKVDVMSTKKDLGGNKQEIARKLRYDVFARVAKQLEIKYILLAHHLDDQAETIFMRMIRGSSTQGLVGMRTKRVWKEFLLLRPLLTVPKCLIENFCEINHLSPRVDQSNLSIDYTRNYIRLSIFPQLEKINPKVKETLVQMGKRLAEEEEVWKQWGEKAYLQVVLGDSDHQYTLSRTEFAHLPIALQRRVVKLILSSITTIVDVEMSHARIEQIRNFILTPSPSGELHIDKGWRLERSYEIVTIWKQTHRNQSASLTLDELQLNIPGMTELDPFFGKLEARLLFQPTLENELSDSHQEVFDADHVDLNQIIVRTRKPGDRMSCFGLKGTKKIKDLMIEAKIPKNNRDRIPVIQCGEQILWIPGVRRSAIAPVTNQTKRYLHLIWHLTE